MLRSCSGEPAARPRHRRSADHDQKLRDGRRSRHQIQPADRRRPAYGPLARTRRRDLQYLEAGGSQTGNPVDTRRTREPDMAWERISYFLDRVIPVASQYKIRMALHPDDPSVPSPGYQGVERVLGTVDGIKRFITIQENPYHGLNFCQGTVSRCLPTRAPRSST